MKALRMIAGLALLAALASCGGSTEEAAAPVMPAVVGRQLDTALNEIKSAGFKEKVDVAGGGTFGIVEEANWQVCTQLPEAGSPISTAPQLSVKRLCEESTEGTTTTSSSASSSSPSDPPTTQPEVPLTVQTSPELASLLIEKDNCGASVEQFAAAHPGSLIEFDGNIAFMTKSGNYKTRFDFLVYPGDYSTTTASGPSCKYTDVSYYDLGVTGPNPPEQVAAGDNLHFVARVDYFNKTQCLFYLKPVSTSAR